MKNRAGKTVQNLSGDMAYSSFYPQPKPPVTRPGRSTVNARQTLQIVFDLLLIYRENRV